MHCERFIGDAVSAMVQGYNGAIVQWCNGEMVKWCNDTMVQWCNKTVIVTILSTSGPFRLVSVKCVGNVRLSKNAGLFWTQFC